MSRVVRGKLSYEQWHALRLATYIAAALAFSHQLAGPDLAGHHASTARDVIFRAELDAIARRRGARVIYLIGPSSDPSNALAAERLSQLVPDLRHHDVYLCASPGLSSAMRAALYGAGLPHRQIHEEVFSFYIVDEQESDAELGHLRRQALFPHGVPPFPCDPSPEGGMGGHGHRPGASRRLWWVGIRRASGATTARRG